jgi:hypothetical protein
MFVIFNSRVLHLCTTLQHIEVLERQKVFLDKNGRASIGIEALFALKEEHLLSQRLEPLHLTAYVPRLPIPPPEDNHVYDMVQLMPCHKGDAKHLKVWIAYIYIYLYGLCQKLFFFHRALFLNPNPYLLPHNITIQNMCRSQVSQSPRGVAQRTGKSSHNEMH